jgi:hypothetical protein
MAELGDFDLLRDVKNDIRSHSWANPQFRDAMILHFRLKRAREEIYRLNIEIRRQVTYMRDEYMLYKTTAKRLGGENPNLAKYIQKEAAHMDIIFTYVTFYLTKTRALPGFSGTLEPGTRQETTTAPTIEKPPWLRTLCGEQVGNDLTNYESDDPTNAEGNRDLIAEELDEDIEEETVMDWMESLVLA